MKRPTKHDHRQAAKREINKTRRELGLNALEFPAWLPAVSPYWSWNWRHQLYLYEKLDLVTRGLCKRLMIFMPPRHSKSETVTVRYSAYRLEQNPRMNIILGCYNQKLANRFSRKTRRICASRIALASDRKAVEEWETAIGGGFRAVGVGGGITGFGGDLIMIDDPVKNREEAESKTYREKCWDWFKDDLYTRLEPGAAMVLTMTRWHDDDLAGRLLKEMAEDGGEHWEVVSLPAIAEEGFTTEAQSHGEEEEEINAETRRRGVQEGESLSEGSSGSNPLRLGVSALNSSSDPLGREPGEALCPERYDIEALERLKKKLGAYSFAALFQQRPIPIEGALFKRSWFPADKIRDKAPEGLRWARGYDLAVSTKTSADYTASFRCAFDKEGNLWIADGFRKRIEYPEQRRYAVQRMVAEGRTQHGIEKALHGQAFVQDLRRVPAVRNVAFKAVKVDTDKFTRALPWANLAEEGKVYLVRGTWLNDLLDELTRFTGNGDTHDDQVDAISIAVSMLTKRSGKLLTF
ncbi:MAG: phage terminase large subunit [Acidobacteria bacterium]|nr:phage terminase large subunit [Acidobacteriota bacterium]